MSRNSIVSPRRRGTRKARRSLHDRRVPPPKRRRIPVLPNASAGTGEPTVTLRQGP
ncbi:tRNA lysidine(34) synthetase TilS [Bradyrhizobium sp. 4]|nr:tRNA lysidine(34) synthetase TilS [Bradyrhizobium sp. 39]MCK1750321.1 tRNA lysidine(34) synthetase TilS [Bradyrhizobium sp. 135]UPJ38804.1 tRNA lysidine(34) synthetase TilS [Bradyrhizobium sp. 4]